jgi:hypothetical protein
MKKTLFIIMALVAASFFAVPAFADGEGEGEIDGGEPPYITRLYSSASQIAKPRTEAYGGVEVYIAPNLISITATTERPVKLRVVDLCSGQTEELPSIYFSIFQLPPTFSPDYMVIEADGDVTLYGLDGPSL